ncbi:Protein of unknown function [Pseudidiomarina maritima]|uniref:YagK/YfjJ C-terminal domain-containing protein n=1 Tax=Pseudidiomarina maritima TaxID=519453 RepID=A0A1I6H7U5_9GAMM|nr:Protein of unknown function [Pseudidiomarina maritima]
MNHSYKETWFHHRGIDWLVNARGSGLDPQILRKVLDVPLWMLNNHRKVFLFRFDLSCYTSQRNNKSISLLISRVKNKVRLQKYSKRIAICWAREIHSADTPHYHVLVALDGSKVNSPYVLSEWIKFYWFHHGRYTAVKYYKLDRTDTDELFQAIWHFSYLAKIRGKEVKFENTRRFSVSFTELY